MSALCQNQHRPPLAIILSIAGNKVLSPGPQINRGRKTIVASSGLYE
jgi:hypothetical protein